MKPPPRTRTKPNYNLKSELVAVPQLSVNVTSKWQRAEQRKLLNGLKRLRRTAECHSDIDYAFLRKCVPSRSISEIHSVVQSLKDKVISCASFKLKKKRWEEKKVTKPIEMWTHMSSAVAGILEESISCAFSQMLIVSSTEPCTLRNCDPPQVHRPPTDETRLTGRTIPFRPMPRLQVQGEHPGSNTALKTPVPAKGTAKILPSQSQVLKVPNIEIPHQHQPFTTAGASPAATSTSQSAATSYQLGTTETLTVPCTSPPFASQIVKPVTGHITPSSRHAGSKTQNNGISAIQTTQPPAEQQPTLICTSSTFKSTSPSPHTAHCSSITNLNRVPSTAPPPVTFSSSATSSFSSTYPAVPLTTPATAFHARFGRTSKYATKDSPRTFGVKCVVDFERIYRYLSVLHKPNKDCHLTPMESAIVLDLLMSLPEELSLLDCNKLQKHLIQVYKCLSSPADSRITRDIFKDLKDGLSTQTEAQRDESSSKTGKQQQTPVTADSSNIMDSGGNKLKPNGSENEGALGDADDMGLCPPLNPFMVPLKLLMRR